MQSHSTLPCGVRNQQRALADRKIRLRADADHARLVLAVAIEAARRERLGVVQLWPAGGTYCRSSSKIAHCAGGRFARRHMRAAGSADEGVMRSPFWRMIAYPCVRASIRQALHCGGQHVAYCAARSRLR